MENKTLLLVGETGAGKSNLINYMVNYLYGVRWTDNKRYQLVKDEEKCQAESQTSHVTVYEIFRQEREQQPFSLTIVDTPGFGDTNGIEQDQLITSNLAELFNSENGVHQIDAVCLVVKEDTQRLTHTQRYIFESILSVFGKDISDNIVALITFATNVKGTPPVLKAIKTANVPCSKKTLKFNSSTFGKRSGDQQDESHWRMGEESMKRFFSLLSELETRSLVLTKEVLDERRHLQACIDGLEHHLQITIDKQNELSQIGGALKANNDIIKDQKDFEFEVTIYEPVRSPSGKMATSCQKCQVTCHRRCPLAPANKLIFCDVMRWGKCKVCPGKCSWQDHIKEKVVYIRTPKKVLKKYSDLKKEYEEGLVIPITSEELEMKIQSELTKAEENGQKLLEASYKCVARLEEIALRPNPMTAEQYLDILIKRERKTDRIEKFEKMKLKARITCLMVKENLVENGQATLEHVKTRLRPTIKPNK